MSPNLSTGYPQPVDIFVEKMWAKFLLYDKLLKIPEICRNVDK
jgi:hypothetical protein